MPELDFFTPPPAVPGVTDVGDEQRRHLQTLSDAFGLPNRFQNARSSFEQGIELLGKAAKEDPRLTPIVASALRLLHGTGKDVPMPRRSGDTGETVSSLPLPGGAVKVKGA
jgi:hypothetical protein